MFPLSPLAGLIVYAAAVYLVSAGLFTLVGRGWGLLLAPLLGIVAWVLGRALTGTETESYFPGLDVILGIVFYTAIFGVAAFFAWIVRGFFTEETDNLGLRIGALVFLCMPAFIGAGAAVTRQYVPDSPCSNSGVSVLLGDTRLYVPIEFAPILVFNADSMNPLEWLKYEYSSKYKRDLNRICHRTQNGNAVAPVNDIMLSPSRISQTVDATCSGPDSTRKVCDGHASNHYSDVIGIRLTTKFDRHWAHLKHNFTKKDAPRLHTSGGRKAGFACWEAKPTKAKAHCYVWRSLDDKAMLLIETGYFANRSVAELLANAQSAMAYSLRAMAQ